MNVFEFITKKVEDKIEKILDIRDRISTIYIIFRESRICGLEKAILMQKY